MGSSHSTTLDEDLIQLSGTLATPINICCCMLKNGSPREFIYSMLYRHVNF